MPTSLGYKILLDGYNIIMRNPSWAHQPLEASRKLLVSRAAQMKWPVPVEGITIIFDAKGSEPTRYRPFEKIVTCFVPDADKEIQREIREKQPQRPCLLISDDAELKSTAKAHGVTIHTVSWFINLAPVSKGNRHPQFKEGGEKISITAARKITEELGNYWLRHEKK